MPVDPAGDWQPGPDLEAIAHLDHDRSARRGYPEAVYCEGKTVAQVSTIARSLADQGTPCLFTRVSDDQAAAITEVFPDAEYHRDAHVVSWSPSPPEPAGGLVVVLSAGTSDLPVAKEAQITASHLGRRTELIVDIGVAGLHRVLGNLDLIRQADCVVVAAGMDGALPSVVAGLISAPVVAVPTSVGYGAAFGGVAALLSMLNACAPGVAVVNIDNGYGAGHLAAQIANTPPT